MKLKALLATTIPLVALSFLLVACPDNSEKDAQLTLCTNASYPPYESIDDQGKPEGFDIDMAQAIADEMKKPLVVRDMAFDALILSLKQGKCDMIMAGLSITPSRQKEIAMVPYQGEPVHSYFLLFFEKVPEGVSSVEDLAKVGNKTIAVQAGTRMEEYLKQFSGITVKPLEATTELVLDVTHKKSLAALVEPQSAAILLGNLQSLKGVEIKLPESQWDLGNGIGVEKSRSEFIQTIESSVAELKKRGVVASLEKKWFSKG